VSALIGAIVTVYGVFGAAASLLQARQMQRRECSDDVSLGFLGSLLGGYVIWLLYGITVGDLPLIVVDVVGLLAGSVAYRVAIRQRSSLQRSGFCGKAVRRLTR
jgi:uncharacterized protein with PQ loop repeat